MAGKVTSLNKDLKQPPQLQVASIERSDLFLSRQFERYNPDLLAARRGGLGIYAKMMLDEQVKAVLRFKQHSVVGRGYQFSFDKRTKLSKEEQQKRLAVMQSVTQQMRGSFMDTLASTLKAMQFGFSLQEVVHDTIQVDGASYVGINKIVSRDVMSFTFYTDDYGELQRFVQKVNAKEIELNLAKFIHYVQNPDEDAYYGQSELRAAYRSWFMKDTILKFWTLYLERFAGGFMAIKLGASGINPQSPDYVELQKVLSNMRSTMGVLLPNGVESELTMPSTTDAYEKAVNFHDLAIAKSLLIPNLLGLSNSGQTGAYAQSQTQLEAYFMTIAADAARLEDTLNDQLFAPLAKQNWDDGEFPRFQLKKASAEFVKWVVTSWKEMVAANAVVTTETDEAHLRDLLEMPVRSEDDEPLVTPQQEQQAKDAEIARQDAAVTLDKTHAHEVTLAKLKPAGKAAFSEWDESKHPRHPAGDDQGGEFAPKAVSETEQQPLTEEEKAARKAQVKELVAKMQPYVSAGDLTGTQAQEFKKLRDQLTELEYDVRSPATDKSLAKTTPAQRMSTLSDEVYKTASKDALKSKEVFRALKEHVTGSSFGSHTPIDAILEGKNPNVSAQKLYDTFTPTREALRAQYGNEIPAFRAVGKQMAKPVENWATTEAFAKQFGSKVVKKSIQVDDVVAMNVTNNGMYHELIVRTPASKFSEQQTFSIDAALQRVDFAYMAQRALAIETDTTDQLATASARALAELLSTEKLAAFIADPQAIGAAEIDRVSVGKLKAIFRSALERGWSTGLNQAMSETAKARRQLMSADDRKLHFKSLRDNAADFFDSNSFRMAGNLTDGMRAIVQQELQQAVKSGRRPDELASRIYDRLIRKGFTTLDAVKGTDSREEVILQLTQLLADALETANVPAYLNTLTRTNTFEAMNEARFAEFTDPALGDFIVALRYSAVLDDRTTDICQELHGHVHLKDSKVWDEYRPPNHFNCRSVVYAVTKLDGWDGVESPEPTAKPAEGFK